MVLLTDDSPKYLEALPILESDTKNIIAYIRALPGALEVVNRHPNAVMEEMIARELPHFARFLLERGVPEGVTPDAQWGIASFHDPTMLRSSEVRSQCDDIEEILNYWRQKYWASADHRAEPCWSGNLGELMNTIMTMDIVRWILVSMPCRVLRSRIIELSTRVPWIEYSNRVIVIHRPEVVPHAGHFISATGGV